MYDDLSFHALQAAEKAIKAVYVKLGMRFPYTHDIGAIVKSGQIVGAFRGRCQSGCRFHLFLDIIKTHL